MFYKIAMRNVKRDINKYLIYFISLVIAISSFYIVLSIETQDVITFLKNFESDAVKKLLVYIQIIFVFCLIIMFFLVLFANKFLLKRRQKELGIYLMMGMKQGKIFLMLMLEGLITSLLALVVGISVGILLSDLISLFTARIFEIGIIGHSFTVSKKAIFETIGGFLLIQTIVLLYGAHSVYRLDLFTLLYGNTKNKKVNKQNNLLSIFILIVGVVFLIIAYIVLLMNGLMKIKLMQLVMILFFGFIGTILVFFGITSLMIYIKKKDVKRYYKGLNFFTNRQIEEQIKGRYISISMISILLFLSLSFLTVGYSIAYDNESKKIAKYNVFDFTLRGSTKNIEKVLSSPKIKPYISNLIHINLGAINSEETELNFEGFYEKIPMSENNSKSIKEYFESVASKYIYAIKQSEYNKILNLANLKPLNLKSGEATIYSNMEFGENHDIINKALQFEPIIKIGNKNIKMKGQVQAINIVTDRFINIYCGLIINDEDFDKYVSFKDTDNGYWNFILPKSIVNKKGKITVTQGLLNCFNSYKYHNTGENFVEFESSLQTFSRKLVIAISGSYTLIYIGIIFLIVTGTVLSLQFITVMKENKKRYNILKEIGTSLEQMKKSLHKQVTLYFILPLGLAIINTVVSIYAIMGVVIPRGFSLESSLICILFIGIILIIIYGLYYLYVCKVSDKILLNLQNESK